MPSTVIHFTASFVPIFITVWCFSSFNGTFKGKHAHDREWDQSTES